MPNNLKKYSDKSLCQIVGPYLLQTFTLKIVCKKMDLKKIVRKLKILIVGDLALYQIILNEKVDHQVRSQVAVEAVPQSFKIMGTWSGTWRVLFLLPLLFPYFSSFFSSFTVSLPSFYSSFLLPECSSYS